MSAFQNVITSLDELRSVIEAPPPGTRSLLKERPALDPHTRAFIALSPFVLVGTSDASGRCDVSPRGDAPGFVQVLDDHRLVLPERPGNRRLDSLQNLLTNPHVGLLFFVPGREDTLRVNGRAWITRDEDLLRKSVVQGKMPQLAVGVEIEQCFFHCAKALIRSRLWTHKEWPDRNALPSYACMVFEQVKPEGLTLGDYERDIAEGNATRLY